jgi:hypothetical protein
MRNLNEGFLVYLNAIMPARACWFEFKGLNNLLKLFKPFLCLGMFVNWIINDKSLSKTLGSTKSQNYEYSTSFI